MNENVKTLKDLSISVSDKDRLASEFRQSNRKWLKKSRQIALSVMHQIEEQGIKKTELANMVGVSPSYIGKLLRGKENLTLETISKLEDALGVELQIINRTYFKSPIYMMSSEVEVSQSTNLYCFNQQTFAV